MSTRTNISIRYGESLVILYRHCDGYPACAGESIVRAILGGSNADNVLRALMREEYAATSYRPARPVFELTSSIHGDIDHEYLVTFHRHTGALEHLAHRRRLNWADDPSYSWTPWTRHTLESFVRLVNSEREQMNARIRERGLPYTEDDLFAMIEIATPEPAQ